MKINWKKVTWNPLTITTLSINLRCWFVCGDLSRGTLRDLLCMRCLYGVVLLWASLGLGLNSCSLSKAMCHKTLPRRIKFTRVFLCTTRMHAPKFCNICFLVIFEWKVSTSEAMSMQLVNEQGSKVIFVLPVHQWAVELLKRFLEDMSDGGNATFFR